MFLKYRFLKCYSALLLLSSLPLNATEWCEADPYMDKLLHQFDHRGGYCYSVPWTDNGTKYASPEQSAAYGAVGTDARGMSTFTPNPNYDTPMLDQPSASWAAEIDGYTSYPWESANHALAPDPTFQGYYRFAYAEDGPMIAAALPRAPAVIPAASSPAIKTKKPRRHILAGHYFSRAFHSVKRFFTKKVHEERKDLRRAKKS